ncbi:MAG: acyl-CoA reductase [Bacteroidetes bacterium]|nr:acyl-CoA reductase [Bacteroidota bacterium]
MELKSRIDSFSRLGGFLREFQDEGKRREDPLFSGLEEAIIRAGLLNPWFTRESVLAALRSWALSLTREELESWLKPYSSLLATIETENNVAVIMAGNLPLVGFHDFLCVLLSGNRFTGRLSSDDTELLPALASILVHFDPEWEERITFTKERISGFDAVIATGNNNSAHYFDYYFSKVPHIIRKNRNGIAILTGEEDNLELSGLADDIFLYYGLGCRNVSKIYFPAGYDMGPLFSAFHRYVSFSTHHKWMNNHDYYRSIFLLNQIPSLDNGFMILTENKAIASPPAVLYYEYYEDMDTILEQLSFQKEEIQVAVCKKNIPFPSCRPGQAQKPGLADYADGMDTLQFLLGLSK